MHLLRPAALAQEPPPGSQRQAAGRPEEEEAAVQVAREEIARGETISLEEIRATPHLRHSHGGRGHAMRTLQHWTGHADSKTTQIYAHYQPSDQEADAVDLAFA